MSTKDITERIICSFWYNNDVGDYLLYRFFNIVKAKSVIMIKISMIFETI